MRSSRYITIAFKEPLTEDDERSLVRTFLLLNGVERVTVEADDPNFRDAGIGAELIGALRRALSP